MSDPIRDAAIEASLLAWHDATCPEGAECRARSLHADGRSTPVSGPLAKVVDAALAAADPAPDSGQGEDDGSPLTERAKVDPRTSAPEYGSHVDVDSPFDQKEWLRRKLQERFGNITSDEWPRGGLLTPAASGGGAEADGDQGEADCGVFDNEYNPCVLPGGHGGPHAWTPAAEHDDLDAKSSGRPSDVSDGQPVRATLPDTPWTTVRVTLNVDTFGTPVWRLEDDGPNLWRWAGDRGTFVPAELIANVVDFTILAEPPKADRDNLSDKLSGSTPVDSGVQPADTDAPHGNGDGGFALFLRDDLPRIMKAVEDRAAARAEKKVDAALQYVDEQVAEALAVVVKAAKHVIHGSPQTASVQIDRTDTEEKND